MTPKEFWLYVQGCQRRFNREDHLAAILGTMLYNSWVDKKHHLSPEKLLGWKPKKPKIVYAEQVDALFFKIDGDPEQSAKDYIAYMKQRQAEITAEAERLEEEGELEDEE